MLALRSPKIRARRLWFSEVCAMNSVPLSNTLDHRIYRNSVSLLIRKPRLVSPNTQHTQRDGWTKQKETQRGPLSVAAGSDSRGRPDPFTFVSLNGFNSSWRGERGGLQNEWERWAEEFQYFCPRTQSQRVAETARAQRQQQQQQQHVYVIYNHSVWGWMLATKRRGGGEGGVPAL